ncbi:hypothetical protein IEO21_02946 [Rhodonia placenta]|uniref:Uncharacterized protein n=1 Tax=Rhodonia placenta TaxID=104341 RepID=A0A8H7U3Z8_9APHY|nr:hypothetical protein IEO21_02946 [Postia placenta]
MRMSLIRVHRRANIAENVPMWAMDMVLAPLEAWLPPLRKTCPGPFHR